MWHHFLQATRASKWKWLDWLDRLFTTPWTVPHQAPPSMGFSRQEYSKCSLKKVWFFFSGEVPVRNPLSNLIQLSWNLLDGPTRGCHFSEAEYLTGVFLASPWKRLLSSCNLGDGRSPSWNLTSSSRRLWIRASCLSGSRISRRVNAAGHHAFKDFIIFLQTDTTGFINLS